MPISSKQWHTMLSILILGFGFGSLSHAYDINTNTWQHHGSSPKPVKAQFDVDTALLLETMFPPSDKIETFMKRYPEITGIDAKQAGKADFLKRLMLMMVLGDVEMSPHKNGIESKVKNNVYKPWAYPMSSLIMHGQRVLVEFYDDSAKSTYEKLYNFLTTGNMDTPPTGIVTCSRMWGSHNTSYDVEKSRVLEIKLSGAGLRKALKRRHRCVALALGGIGSEFIDARAFPDFDKTLKAERPPLHTWIGPGGFIYPQDRTLIPYFNKKGKGVDSPKKYQIGHLYLFYKAHKPSIMQKKRPHLAGKKLTSLLIGFEGNGPGVTNPYPGGTTHNASAGVRNSDFDPTPPGSIKWDIWPEISDKPAKYGGKRVSIRDNASYLKIQNKIAEFLALPPKDQRRIMKTVLELKQPEAKTTLNAAL